MSKRYYFTAVKYFTKGEPNFSNPELYGPYESRSARRDELEKNFQGESCGSVGSSYVVVLFVQNDSGELIVDDKKRTSACYF